MKKLGALWFLIVMFSMLLLISCDVFQKNKLTREKAKEIIIRDCFGGDNNLPAIGLLRTGGDIFVLDNDLPFLKKLTSRGLLTMQVSPPPWNKPYYNIFISDSAKPFVLKKEEEMDMGKKIINAVIKLGNLTINEVTGIKLTNENKAASVDFNYKFTNLTPFGDNWYEGPTIGNLMKRSDLTITKFLKITADKDLEAKFDYKKKEPALQQAIVKMELFDDGWRVAKRKNNQE